MKAVHNDVVLGTGVAVLAALGCWRAMEFIPNARFFPLLILAPAVVIGIAIAVRGQLRLVRLGNNPRFFTSPRPFFLVVGMMTLGLVVLSHLGFLTTSALIIPTLSYLLGYRKPLPVFITTVLFLAMVYIVFIKLLSRPLPDEIWTLIIGG